MIISSAGIEPNGKIYRQGLFQITTINKWEPECRTHLYKRIKSSYSKLTRCLKFAGDPWVQPVQAGTPAQKMQIYESNGRFVCGVCHKSYNSRPACNNHYHVHLGNTTCGICSRIMSNKEALTRHVAKHLGSIRCERCNQTFASKAILKGHQQTSKCGKELV